MHNRTDMHGQSAQLYPLQDKEKPGDGFSDNPLSRV